MPIAKETRTEIEGIRARAAELQREVAAREQEARDAAVQADRMERALQVHRERGSVAFHTETLATYQDERNTRLTALTDARTAFADAVLAGAPFVPAFIAIKQAEHEMAVHSALHEFAVARLRNSTLSMRRNELPDGTLLDEINRVVEAQVAPLREIDSEARRRVSEAVDKWSDDHAVAFDDAGEMEVMA